VRRDLGQIGLAAILLLMGYAANQRWNTQIGGWREIGAVVGGVIFVAMLIVLPVALIAAAIRQARS
jgi:hypothetical protein